MTQSDYLLQLQALLPVGLAWPRDPDAVLTQVLAGVAEEPARVDARGWSLLEEVDPRTTNELLVDWERVTAQNPAEGATLEDRRRAVTSVLAMRGGQSPTYFIALAASIGYAITLTEYRPFCAGSSAGGACTNTGARFSAGSTAGSALQTGNWRFVWQVNASESTIFQFQAGSTAGEALRRWGNTRLEELVRKWCPAHTYVQFAYN